MDWRGWEKRTGKEGASRVQREQRSISQPAHAVRPRAIQFPSMGLFPLILKIGGGFS